MASAPIGGRNFQIPSAACALLLACVCAGPLAGCGKDGGEIKPTSAKAPLPPPTSGTEALERMVTAYQSAVSYADQGRFVLSYDADGKHYPGMIDCAVALVKPNKVRMQAYGAVVACDGEHLRATLPQFVGQILSKPAPKVISTAAIVADPFIEGYLAQLPIAGPPLVLALLLNENPLAPFLSGAEKPVLLPSESLGEHRCYRVRVTRDANNFVFWIDNQSYLLRRLELPTAQFEEYARGQHRDVSNVTAWLDPEGAVFDVEIPLQAFQFEMSSNVSLVSKFSPPRPESISPLLGQPAPNFKFQKLDGQEITRDSLAGKVAVLDFWATWCGPCDPALKELAALAEKFANDDRVVIVAVSIDRLPGESSAGKPPSDEVSEQPVTDDEVRRAVERLGVKLSLARDANGDAKNVFGVTRIPNWFVLGPDGTVEDHDIGGGPETGAAPLVDQLRPRIEKLLAGAHVYPDVLRQHDERMRQYDELVTAADAAAAKAAATNVPPNTPKPPTTASIAPRQEPQRWKLTELWRSQELKQPGQVLVVNDSADKPLILTLDGWQTVAQFDAAGKLVARHALDMPTDVEPGVVTSLRTATDQAGRRYFVGSAPGRQQLHVFDGAFNRLLSYPDFASGGVIADWQIADLDGDGALELAVGYFDVVGVQGVSLAGKRLWGNRSVANVFRIAVADPNAQGQRSLWCANELGNIATIDHGGISGPTIAVANRFIRGVFAASLTPSRPHEILALAYLRAGVDAPIGLSPRGSELWAGPEMPMQPSLEVLCSGPLPGGAGWVIAGADGTLTAISAAGQVLEKMFWGKAIAGLGIWTDATGPVLLVSDADGFSAWRIDAK